MTACTSRDWKQHSGGGFPPGNSRVINTSIGTVKTEKEATDIMTLSPPREVCSNRKAETCTDNQRVRRLEMVVQGCALDTPNEKPVDTF